MRIITFKVKESFQKSLLSYFAVNEIRIEKETENKKHSDDTHDAFKWYKI